VASTIDVSARRDAAVLQVFQGSGEATPLVAARNGLIAMLVGHGAARVARGAAPAKSATIRRPLAQLDHPQMDGMICDPPRLSFLTGLADHKPGW
jgi:hypothetical protein